MGKIKVLYLFYQNILFVSVMNCDFMYHDKMLDQDNYICSRTMIPDMMNIKKAKIIAIVSAII